MTDDRHARVTELFLEAADRPPAERAAFLDEACAGDDALRREVEAMLAFEDTAPDFLDSSADLLADARAEAAAPLARLRTDGVPEVVGSFRILGLLGEGGMGSVYEAEQRSPRRRVALKILARGLGSERATRRFEFEAQVLGQLRHPGIAQIFEAGRTDTAAGPRPYFALELIEGEPITRWCEGRPLAERVELLARVADAVQFAHNKGVIHRDLKAGNILVEASGQPKVLDFGVARVTETSELDPQQTQAGHIVGTLQCMSPEQAAADPTVDTRSDVYALGVLAYEVLSGERPYELGDLPILEAVRLIRDQEPTRIGAQDPALRGDLELIVAQAMEKDRDRRYATAAAMADDLRRHLAHQPVSAQPPTGLYRLRKFVRRNTGLAAGMAATAVALLVGLGVSLWQVHEKTLAEADALANAEAATAFAIEATEARVKATAARDEAREARDDARDARDDALLAQAEAERERDAAVAIQTYLLTDVIASPDPRTEGRDVKVVDTLARAADGVGAAFGEQPLVEAAVRAALARSFLALDVADAAYEQGRAAEALFLEHAGADDIATLAVRGTLVQACLIDERLDEGLALARPTLERQLAVLGEEHEDTLTTMTNLATLLREAGEREEALALLRRVLAVRERVLGPRAAQTLTTRWNLSRMLAASGQRQEAREHLDAVAEARLEDFGPEHPDTLIVQGTLILHRLEEGALADPVETTQAYVDAVRRVFGDEHHRLANALAVQSVVYDRLGRPKETAVAILQAYELSRKRFGDAHSTTQGYRLQVSQALSRIGEGTKAAALAGQAVDLALAAPPGAAPGVADCRVIYGEMLALIGRLDEAEEQLVLALEGFEDHPAGRGYVGWQRATGNLDAVRRRKAQR